jgi:mono/diheme cytochrome c family protein
MSHLRVLRSWLRVHAGIAFLLACASGFGVSVSAQEMAPIDITDPVNIAKGQQLFNTTCAFYCHGPNGTRSKAPSLQNRTELSATDIYTVIANGRTRAGKFMPAWKESMTPEQIWATVAFIVSLRRTRRNWRSLKMMK